jgi:hypothetical protein
MDLLFDPSAAATDPATRAVAENHAPGSTDASICSEPIIRGVSFSRGAFRVVNDEEADISGLKATHWRPAPYASPGEDG